MTRVYVCDRCTFMQYHPLSYCPLCPGRLHQREYNSPGRFQTTADLVAFWKTQGIDYIGEYPKVTKRRELEISIARAEEHIAQARDDMASGRVKNPNWNPVKYWTDLRDKDLEKLAGLGE